MKKSILTLLTLSGLYLGAFAQRNPDYVSKFDTKIETILLNNLTGNIIVKEATKTSSFNPQTNVIDWVITNEQLSKMSTEATLNKVNDFTSDLDLSKLFQSADKLRFIDNSSFIQANINAKDVIINALDGKIVFNSASKPYRVVLSQYMPGEDKFLFLTTEGKDFKCVLYDLKTATDKWDTSVATKESMLKSFSLNSNNKLATKDAVIATADAIYATMNNTLIKLNKETGKIAWKAAEAVHRFYLSNDNKNVIIMCNAGSFLSSKRALNVINAENSTLLFKDDIVTKYISYIEDWGNKFLVAHSTGFNFYDYTTGKKIWKKDAKGDDIKKVIPIGNDYLYIADNEMSLIDSDGKQKWKDFVEISDDKEDAVYFLNKIDNNKVFYLTGTYGNMVDYTTGKKVWKGNIKFDSKLPLLYGYDEQTKSFLVYNDEKLYKFDPTAKDKPEAFAKIKVKNDKTLSNLQLFDWGVSLTGEYEVIGINKDGTTKFQKTYKEPGEGLRRLTKIGGIIGCSYLDTKAGLQQGLSEATYVSRDANGTVVQEGYLLTEASREKMANKAAINNLASAAITENITSKVNARFKALKQNGDFAFIFARGETDQSNYLVKVRKSDGVEVDKISIDNTKPLYEIDGVNENLYYVYQNELRVFSKK